MRTVDDAERQARVVAGHHLARTAPDVAHAVRDLVAMHSSDPLTPHIGLWARVPEFRPDHLDAALVERTLWRLHSLRRTLWIVDTDEAALFRAAAIKIADVERKRVLGWLEQVTDDGEACTRCTARPPRPRSTHPAVTASSTNLDAWRPGMGSWVWPAAAGVGPWMPSSRKGRSGGQGIKVGRTEPATSNVRVDQR